LDENRVRTNEKRFVLTGENIRWWQTFFYVEKRFCRRQKIPSSTSSVWLGRKPCSYQRRTFCLTGKNSVV